MNMPDTQGPSDDHAQLDEHSASPDPLQQFAQWFNDACEVGEPLPSAMTVATVGSDLRPSTRLVLCKDFDERGIVFYTHYDSRKSRELAGNPFAALQFHWKQLERQVRIEGRVAIVEDDESDAYFASRPLGSRIGAWASPQSEVITDRAVLSDAVREYEARFGDAPPRPPRWGGYRLIADRWEFWQGRQSRLHDRLCYRLERGAWLIERLAP